MAEAFWPALPSIPGPDAVQLAGILGDGRHGLESLPPGLHTIHRAIIPLLLCAKGQRKGPEAGRKEGGKEGRKEGKGRK